VSSNIVMGLEFAILYKGKTEKGKKTIKTMMAWDEKTVIKKIKENFSIKNDIDFALKKTIAEFKKESSKIP
jgi:hypothetical protein